MMEVFNMRDFTISRADSKNSLNWMPAKETWAAFCESVEVPVRTKETSARYGQMSKLQKAQLKDVGGYVAGLIEGGRRTVGNLKSRSMLALDADSVGKLDFVAAVAAVLHDYNYAIYSTRSHTATSGRYRLIVPMARDLAPDEYQAITRKLAGLINIELFDPTTFQPHRLMYNPSCSADAEYIYHAVQDKVLLGAQSMLDLYTDWHNVAEWPTPIAGKIIISDSTKRQGDPEGKPGMVGLFCRAYSLEDAMDKLLPGVYEPTADGRYTYMAGSSAGGAVLYDSKFVYSHHGTDPCSEQLCNAFDMVRLHKFGLKDSEASEDTHVSRLPSYAAMLDFASGLDAVKKLAFAERSADFSNIPTLDDPKHPPVNPAPENLDWQSELEVNRKTGNAMPTYCNLGLIIQNDAILKGTYMDMFADQPKTQGGLPWDDRKCLRCWSDTDDAALRMYVEKKYGVSNVGKLKDAFTVCLLREHPVREYFSHIVWDGIPRIERLLIDFLGVADTPYARIVTRKTLIAAVARIMTPGCKFDNMLTLVGKQGSMKSTLIRILGDPWYTDSMRRIDDKDAMENLQAAWIIEMAELAALKNMPEEKVKNFLSSGADKYRASYASRSIYHPRQCIFIGTTNNMEYLNDPTGSRRYWSVLCERAAATKDPYTIDNAYRNQLWAEAKAYFEAGEVLHLGTEWDDVVTAQQERFYETSPWENTILDYVNTARPVDWHRMPMTARLAWISGVGALDAEVSLAPLQSVSVKQLWLEALGGVENKLKRSEHQQIKAILARHPALVEAQTLNADVVHGRQRGFTRIQ